MEWEGSTRGGVAGGVGWVFEGAGVMGIGAVGRAGAGVAVGTASSPIFTIEIQYKLTLCIYYRNSVLIDWMYLLHKFSMNRLFSPASLPIFTK